jgi:hypothetical protein
MVMKMNESTVTEVISATEAVQPTTAIITIHLNPQPTNCDNSSAISGETMVSDVMASDYDTESLQNSQMMVKKSLKLDLTHNNNEIRSADGESADENGDELSPMKSPSSPRTCEFLLGSFEIGKL